jgi:phosphopantetheine--protein transferase-like protein
MKHDDASVRGTLPFALHAAIVWHDTGIPGLKAASFGDDATLDGDAALTCLSATECGKAQALNDPDEKRHFVMRRCFQRAFVHEVLQWQGALADVRIEHRLDTQPLCPDAPDLTLSFSSSGNTAIACASRLHWLGVDIEKHRAIENLGALAQRFFTPAEAESIVDMPMADQNIAFLQHWTAKEAGLKALGKGIVSGLNSFVLAPADTGYRIENTIENTSRAGWKLTYLQTLPQHVVAIVHSLQK